MGNKRGNRRLIRLLFLVPAIIVLFCVLAQAETYPDISALGRAFVLSGNHQFFRRPGGGWVLLSSDSSKTVLTPLLENGTPDCYSGTCLPFVYQAAAACGDSLYFAGNASSPAHSLVIYRYGMESETLIKNITPPVSCDFSRGMKADADGNVLLVTVSFGNVLSADSPFTAYRFIDRDSASCTGTPVQEPESSAPASSEPSSSASSASSADSGVSSAEPAVSAQVYRFGSAVTVEQLRQTLAEQNLGETVRVAAPDGAEVTSGAVGTGCVFTVSRSGQPDRRYTAVIPGDLTGAGAPGEASRLLLYDYIGNRAALSGAALQAADLNNDGNVDTADLLALKKQMK